jgi:hypothetical protein
MRFAGGLISIHDYVGGDPLRSIDPIGLNVYNNSSKPVSCKSEKDGSIITVPPGGIYLGGVDSVKPEGARKTWGHKNA